MPHNNWKIIILAMTALFASLAGVQLFKISNNCSMAIVEEEKMSPDVNYKLIDDAEILQSNIMMGEEPIGSAKGEREDEE